MARPSLPDDLKRDKSEVVRVTREEQIEFTAAAKILGSNKSSLLHIHILDQIEKAKTRDPQKFGRYLALINEQSANRG